MAVTTPSPIVPPRSAGGGMRDRWIIGGLVVLGLVPSLAGTARLIELAGDGQIDADNARFFEQPAPVIAHIVAIVPYALLGAIQFAPGLRRRYRTLHRRLGAVLLPAGIVVAASGLWMTLAYDLPAIDGARFGALGLIRLAVGVAMLGSLTMAAVEIRRRRWHHHGAWMLRAYALAMGAGTQVLTHLPWIIAVGDPEVAGNGVAVRAVLMGAGWAINVAVAEWLIRTGRVAGRRGSG